VRLGLAELERVDRIQQLATPLGGTLPVSGKPIARLSHIITVKNRN
jgi:hypothetical protein